MDQQTTTGVGQESKLHFLDYWRIIRIRKAVIILVFLLVSVTTVFVTLSLKKVYSSKVRIEVHLDSTDIPSINQQSMTGVYDPYFIQTEFEVIRSQAVLDRVVNRLNLNDRWTHELSVPYQLKTSETRDMLRSMMDLSAVRNTSLIDITVYHSEPKEAAELAQTIAEEYKNYRKEQWDTNLSRGIEALQKEMDKMEEQVTNKQARVNELRKKLKPDEAGSASMGMLNPTLDPNTLMQINADIIAKRSQSAQLSTIVSNLESMTPENRCEAIPTLYPDNILPALLQDLYAARSKLAELSATLGPNHPDVVTATRLMDDKTQQINERVKGVMLAANAQLQALLNQIKILEDKLEEAKATDQEKAERTAPYYQAKDDLEEFMKLRDVLLLRVNQENINLHMPTLSMVKIIDDAEPDSKPVRPRKPLNIAVGLIVGLLMGFGLAFFIEYLDTSVKTIDDVERTLQAPVLGVIPQNVGYLLDEGAESPHAEAYRVLRTNLLFSRKDDKLNTVAVVSAGAGEGKSTTVCNLATVFAQSGQRVLMVDSDLRRPTLHRLMKVANTLGLTNYLLKQNTLDQVIQTTKLPTLNFMASGKLPSSSLGILNSAQMRDLITELKGRYDFVFFDSPPIMGVSDASILASEVDMTLQVIQYRRYPQPMNIRAKQLIEKVGGNLIGIVLNNINMAQDETYYYYSGYYHDYYGKNDDENGAPTNGSAREKSRIDVKPEA